MLAIIDMQEVYNDYFFEQGTKKYDIIKNIKKRILFARQKKEWILNLSFDLDGQIISDIKYSLKNYNNKAFLLKKEFDGSTVIHKYIKKQNIIPNKIELCGVFKDVCVLETWKGLKAKGYIVTPVKDNLVISTETNWRNIKEYPIGYLQEN
jgi:nicotinamidase-related amidase